MKSVPRQLAATAARRATSLVKQLPRRHQVLLAAVCSFTLLFLFIPTEPASASKQTTDPLIPTQELMLGQRYQLELKLPEAKPEAPAETEMTDIELVPDPVATLNDIKWTGYEVRSGDSLALIFDRMGLTPQQLYQVTRDPQGEKTLRKIHPGDTLRFARNEAGDLVQLAYQLNPIETLIMTKTTAGYVSEVESKSIEVRESFAHATIKSNFWNAAIDAGMNESQIMALADMFGWDIDFALDIRSGDEFSVLYEKRYADGDFVGYGRILAAEFVNRSKSFVAILHDNGDYYTADGRAMRKSFLRSPVKFTYISSSFNPRRMHPVTGQVRPHNGIDYAANVGTPVMSSGDGKVIASAYNNLNGNYVFIQHGERYVTKYLHLSKRLVKNGQRVRQGDLIGRVGATGRVTGAHLHYEFLVDGVHRNPRTVELPQAEALAKTEMPRFKEIADQRMALLQDNKRVLLAMN
ncbi:peptidoglycan DD-metalloendopeptidase family protein [Pseudidiomarina aestuarii]|uniref:peptidoglycan DD-metalloendopeptidase family protein n=1 Tax=Pseudidiomarina aestuarii TaxID=624146 RepID=UPI003A96C20D